jgi:Tol biopolymer transport system component/DNA-binding winged helix-turn-helix (wHTH) protein
LPVETREGNTQRWSFGIFELDERRSELLRGGTPVKLREQSFRILVLLLERAGDIVTREELRQVLWPSDTYVDFDHSLNTAIMKLRDALGDSADKPLYIETIPKRGYRFIAPVSKPLTAQSATASPLGDSPAATEETADTKQLPPAPPEIPLPSIRRRHLAWLVSGAAVLLILGFVTTWLVRRQPGGAPLAVPPPAALAHSSELVSVRGSVNMPMLSPDAREMAFLWSGQNSVGDLYVQLIRSDRADEKPLRLTHTENGFLCCQSWSPDGREIAYGRCDDTGGAVYTVSALGGPSRRMADVSCTYGAAAWPMWEADGKSLIIIDTCAPGTAPTLMRLTLASGEKHCLGKPVAGISGDMGVALSPDRKTVAFIRLFTSGVSDIYTLTLVNEEIRRVTNEHKAIWNLMWTPDSQQIVFRSSRGGLAAVWRVPARGGAIEKETVYPAVGSISADGKRMVYPTNTASASYLPGPSAAQIVRVELSAAGGKVLSIRDVIALGAFSDAPQLSPDESQIVFGSNSAVSSGWGGEIWKSLADGSDITQLTSLGAYSGTPRWSADGQSIAFDTRPVAHSQIYVMDADGRNQRMLVGDNAENVTPSWSHDGKSLYYASDRTGSFQIWKRDLSTGSERQLTQQGGLGPLESYDGTTLYYSILDHGGLWAVSTTGDNERRLLDAPHVGYWGYFAVTENGVYLLDFTPKATILYYDLERRKLTPVLTMSETPIAEEPGMGASRSGKVLLFGQGDTSSSITMVEYH